MDGESENVENVLCTSCMAENVPTNDFCKECGCPIGQFVNLDPLKRIYSMGWVYRRSASGPISRIVLVGIWLIFGTSLGGSVIMLAALKNFDGISDGPGLWYNILLTLLSAAILYRVTRNYFWWRQKEKVNSEESEKT